MIAGKLDRYITIKTPTISVNAGTGSRSITTYTTYKTVWASRVHDQSMERFEGDQLVLVDTYTYRIRYYDAPAVTATMVIYDDSVTYDILGIKLLERKEGWLITASKRDN